MKKTLLALAVAALSANSFAASLDYTSATPVVVNTIAKEVVTVASPTTLTTTDTIEWPLGFSVTDQNLVRIDLTNGAKFKAAPDLTTTNITTAASVAQGGAGFDYVVLQFGNGATDAFDSAAILELSDLVVANQGDISLRYRLYSSQFDAAQANANTLVDKSYAYAKFANGLVFSSANPGVSRQIDVAAESKKFENNTATSTAFGGLNLSVVANTYGDDLTTGQELDIEDMIGAGAVVTVTGDFSAINATAANTKLDTLTGGSINTEKTAITFNLGATGSVVELDAAKLTYAATGTTVIAPSEFNAKLTLGTGALVKAAPADVANFATLAKNGSTQYVDLALKPGGAYSNFVRISNKSNTSGKVYLTVIADDGAQAQITLGEVAGQASDVLAARSSTTQMNVQDIFAAAAAKGLTLSGEGKLRLVVDGEFKGGDVTNALSNDYALGVQTYTVSKDGNSFATF